MPDSTAPQLTWPNIIGTLGVTLVLAGGAWTLYQSQRAADREYIDARFRAFDARGDERQTVLVRRQDELRERTQEIVKQLHDRVLSKDQFHEFGKSIDERWKTQAEINRQSIDAYLSVKAWEAWRAERDKLIAQLERRINELERQKLMPKPPMP